MTWPMDDPAPSAPPLGVPAPGQPGPPVAGITSRRLDFVLGFAILVACLKAGEWLQHAFGLILPGNILGLFLLLALLGTGIVPPRWVESSARLLLWLLPFLFMPIFILAMSNRTFWAVQGRALAGAVVLGITLLWVFTGHLSQWLFRKTEGGSRKAGGEQKKELVRP